MNPCYRIRSILSSFLLISLILSPAQAQTGIHKETLEDAWNIALKVDRSLRAARRTTESARQILLAARGARLPLLTTESGYIILNNPLITTLDVPNGQLPIPLPNQIPFSEDNFFASTTQVMVPLYTGGRINRGIEAARSSLDAARENEERARSDLKMMVAEAYVAVLRAARIVEVAESHAAGLAAHAADAANLFEQGVVAKNDLLAAQVALADARQLTIQAKNGLDIARAAYNRLLGRPLTQTVELADLQVTEDREEIDALTAKALAQRPELKGIAQQSQALSHQAASERAATRPQVFVSGAYTFLQNRFLVHQNVWSVSVGVRWNIFDGGVARRKAESISQEAQALLDVRADLETNIALQVRQAWLETRETRERIKVASEALLQSQENLKVAKDRYASGVGTNSEVLDAETLRARSYSNYASAVYDAALAGLLLRRAVGDM
ncbi:MAG: TolC family protein [Blastocatellia bacterium]|nr:TolC family protein [Blastocatellia bacterium]